MLVKKPIIIEPEEPSNAHTRYKLEKAAAGFTPFDQADGFLFNDAADYLTSLMPKPFKPVGGEASLSLPQSVLVPQN